MNLNSTYLIMVSTVKLTPCPWKYSQLLISSFVCTKTKTKQCIHWGRSGRDISKSYWQMTRNKGNYIQWILFGPLVGEHTWHFSVSPFAPHLLFQPTEISGATFLSVFSGPNPLALNDFSTSSAQSPSLTSPIISVMHSTIVLHRLVQRCLGLSSSGKGPCHFYFHFARCHVYSQHCINSKSGLKVDFICVQVAKWKLVTSVSDFNVLTH